MSELDPDAVARVLAGALHPPVSVERLEPLTGGASAETYALDVIDGQGAAHAFVLRRDAGGRLLGFVVGKRQEALTQQAAAEAGVPVARVIAIFDTDGEPGDGYVMERLAGETIPRRLLRDAEYAAARQRLVGDCATALAAVHRVPCAALPELPALPAGRQLDQLEIMHRAFGQAVPTFELAIRWLRGHLPSPGTIGLVHGDFRTGNLLVDRQGLVAVLDWELTHLGDPMEDLGWLCVPAWRFGGPGEVGGFGTREALYAAYERVSGHAVDPTRVRFWEVFGTLKWGVVCQAQAFAHLRGDVPSVERAVIGRRVTETELDLLLLIDRPL